MPFEDDVDETSGFGIKRTSEDKLTYKNIIARAINYCLSLRGSKYFHIGVMNLVRTIEFNVSGYRFIDELNKIQQRIMVDKKKKIVSWQLEHGRKFYRRDQRAIMKLELYSWGWDVYFQEVIQLLAKNNLLIETEKTIPVIEVGQNQDEIKPEK